MKPHEYEAMLKARNLEIVKMFADGARPDAVASRFGLTECTVKLINRKATYPAASAAPRARLTDDEHRARNRARSKTRELLARGELSKEPCVRCGSVDVEAHHDDYADPRKIMWLCKVHHGHRHQELGWGYGR